MDLATLGVKVDASGAITELRNFSTAAGTAGTSAATMETSVASLRASVIGLASALGLGLGLREIVTASVDAQRSFAQLQAGVQSTGGAAGYTATQLRDMAKAMQETTGFSHTAIEQTQSILLLFQSLKGVQFQQATQAAADLAARMGTDVPDAARQLGKALEDPTHGLLMLRRAGIVFTQDQTNQIKAMVENGELMKAQTLILDLVTQKVGGSAAAWRDTLGGALANLKNSLTDLIETTRSGSGGIIDFINGLSAHADSVVAALSGIAAGLGLVAAAMAAVKVASIALTATPLGLALTGAVLIASAAVAGYTKGVLAAKVAAEQAKSATAQWTAEIDKLSQHSLKALIESTNLQLDELAGKALLASKATGVIFSPTDAAKVGELETRLKAYNAALAQYSGTAKNAAKATDGQSEAFKKLAEDTQKKLTDDTNAYQFELQHLDLMERTYTAEKKLADLRESQKNAAELQPALNAALPYLEGIGENAHPFSTQSTSTGTGDTQIAAGAAHRAKVATDAANVVDAQYRAAQLNAWTQTYEAEAKAQQETQKVALKEIQKDFSTLFDDLLTNGTNAFASLWNTIKKGFIKLVSDLAAADLMGALKNQFGSTLGGLLPGTNGTPPSAADLKILANPNSGPSAIAGLGTAGAAGGAAGASAGLLGPIAIITTGLGLITSSLIATAQANAQAAKQYAAATVAWQKNFADTITGLETQNSSFASAQSSLTAKFQSLMDSAITAAATAIQNSPASVFTNGIKGILGGADFGLAGALNFGSKVGTVPGAGTVQQLDAYIAQLTQAQGTGKNVAQDRDLATLLKQLIQLDTAWKDQDAALLSQQTEDLKIRDLRATGQGNAANVLALQDQQAAEVQAATAMNASADYMTLLAKTQKDELNNLLASQGATVANPLATATTAVTATVTQETAYQLVDIGRSQLTVLNLIAKHTAQLGRFGQIMNEDLGSTSLAYSFNSGSVAR